MRLGGPEVGAVVYTVEENPRVAWGVGLFGLCG
eukprot:COSAG04_NODE_12921_length_628_cov_1.359168_1_plen_32_part_01